MHKTAKACKYYQVATLPSAESNPDVIQQPTKQIAEISFKGFTEEKLREIFFSANSNGAVPGLIVTEGQLNLLPENYLVSYHNHVIHGHDLPEGLFPIRAGDDLVLHKYALGAYAILCKLFMGLVRYHSRSINPEDKKDAVDYHAWFKRCEYQLKRAIKLYPAGQPPEVVLGGVVYESNGVETYEMLYDIDRFNNWKNNSVGNTLAALTDYWYTNRTQPPAVL